MSDYIFRNEKYDGRNDIAYERYFGQFNHDIRDIRNRVLNQHEDGRSFQSEGYTCTQPGLQSNGQRQSECEDDCFEKELERLLSSMIALIRNAQHQSLQAQVPCINSQCPLLTRGSRSQRGRSQYLSSDFHADGEYMQCIRRCVETDKAECPYTQTQLEHGNNKPEGGINQTTDTFSSVSAHSNIAFPQNTGQDWTNPIHIVSRDTRQPHNHVTPMSGLEVEKDQQHVYTNRNVMKRRPMVLNRLAELGNLLPCDINRSTGRNKSSVLKESIRYIKNLKQEKDLIKELEDKIGEIDAEIKALTLALERLELSSTRKQTSGVEPYQKHTELEKRMTTLITVPTILQRVDNFEPDLVLKESHSKVFSLLSDDSEPDDVFDRIPSKLLSDAHSI